MLKLLEPVPVRTKTPIPVGQQEQCRGTSFHQTSTALTLLHVAKKIEHLMKIKLVMHGDHIS